MRVLGLDIGERRVGVALSDPSRLVASPLCVLDASVLRDVRPLAEIVSEYEVDLLVVGLPLSLDGNEGPQAERVRAVGMRIAQEVGVPVDFVDERHSSAEAARAMRSAGVSEKDGRGRLDMVAAALFLQGYLDRTTRVGTTKAQGDTPKMTEDAG